MTTSIAATPLPGRIVLHCPRCGTEMTTHERSGVVVDQCRDCRAFFLDHGELERLVAAEGGAWLGPVPRPSRATGDPGATHRSGARPVHVASSLRASPRPAHYYSEWCVDDHVPDVLFGRRGRRGR